MRSEPLGCSGRVISTRQKFCATSQMRVSSVATMISRKRFRLLALLDDVLDERLARDERERLAGKPRRSKPRGNDANDFHAAHLATDETRMKHRIYGVTTCGFGF